MKIAGYEYLDVAGCGVVYTSIPTFLFCIVRDEGYHGLVCC